MSLVLNFWLKHHLIWSHWVKFFPLTPNSLKSMKVVAIWLEHSFFEEFLSNHFIYSILQDFTWINYNFRSLFTSLASCQACCFQNVPKETTRERHVPHFSATYSQSRLSHHYGLITWHNNWETPPSSSLLFITSSLSCLSRKTRKATSAFQQSKAAPWRRVHFSENLKNYYDEWRKYKRSYKLFILFRSKITSKWTMETVQQSSVC